MCQIASVLLLPILLGRGAAETSGGTKALEVHLGALKATQNLEAHFVCEKRLAALETPLVSSGRLWIRQGDPREGDGAVRFSTDKPYVSELILVKAKVFVRSQHETEWTKTNQSGRPGLTSIMAQLGGWSTGDAGKIAEMYTVKVSSEPIPAMPAGGEVRGESGPCDNFVLTPSNKDLAKAVKRMTLSIDRASHQLRYIEIVTQQDDATRYWFYDAKTNVKLPADVFSPMSKKTDAATTAPAGEKP